MASSSELQLDALLDSTKPTASAVSLQSEHLSFPTPSNDDISSNRPSPTSEQPRQLLKDRLYVGNLHPTVDEYSLLQIFSKFGKVTKLDFLFHKAGLLKGKPRGYAFVEYGNNDDALKALTMAHDKLLRGRRLVVTFAHQAPLEHGGAPSPYVSSTGSKHRKGMMEVGRPTTLSMLKTGMGSRHDATQDKIAKMEAKLRQMESTNPKPVTSTESSTPSGSNSASRSTLPHHPSLPLKPPPSNLALPQILSSASTSTPRAAQKPKNSLPSLPLRQTQSRPASRGETSGSNSTVGTTPISQLPPRPAKPKLVGVKMKPKEKEK